MVDQVLADGDVARWASAIAPWRSALAAVPRHEFIPNTVWIKNSKRGPTLVPLRQDEDPERWLRLAYSTGYDDYVVTQVDDGQPDEPGQGGSMPTSSASSPVIVAVMLAALDAQPGHRVLEIGTGTGYNAALLAHRLGAEQVTTVEIDSDVAARACGALSETGYGAVCTVTGDGALGYPPRAPYDRIIATAAVQHIPYPWVAQTRPGGRVVFPWACSYTGALVALTVSGDGNACGGIVGESSFMWLRAQRERRGPVADVIGTDEDRATVYTTTLHPHAVAGDQHARFAIGQRVTRCQWRYWPFDECTGAGVFWLLDFTTRSWAKLIHTTPDASEAEFCVHQYGPRRLWNEVHAAHQWWVDRGKPGVGRWRFTVTPKGQRLALS